MKPLKRTQVKEVPTKEQKRSRKHADVLNLRLKLEGSELAEFLEVKHHMQKEYSTDIIRTLIQEYREKNIVAPMAAEKKRKKDLKEKKKKFKNC